MNRPYGPRGSRNPCGRTSPQVLVLFAHPRLANREADGPGPSVSEPSGVFGELTPACRSYGRAQPSVWPRHHDCFLPRSAYRCARAVDPLFSCWAASVNSEEPGSVGAASFRTAGVSAIRSSGRTAD